MIQDNNAYRVMEVFFDSPTKCFQIREICRLIHIGQPSVTIYLNKLLKEGIIIKNTNGIYPSFSANRESFEFRIYKKMDILVKISKSGLLDYLDEKCLPNSIILFGSASKGEDTESSDVDIFIESKPKKLDVHLFEKIIKRDISLFFSDKFNKLTSEIKNNILNGIPLKGYLRVF